ncbi:hypothetical protein [Acinetobacter faecalis]|uniref:hypothetical protein n=1 Tax=Acinetobacter faecalis TaxID=2665161 RepID=UPI002A911871|nr:hypothetical protein [Acinetobacter faecalis]MDY6449688.1 hypothetical protein [Acinetobacter faecalis]
MTQQNTQAVVLQQPNGEKLQVELKITQVADDTTAIKSFEKSADISIASFDYATGIAVFLALCATGLAYWFGVRSFVLTKQSFDSLIEQIKSSECVTLSTNKALIVSQENQKKAELDHASKQIEVDRTFQYGGALIICLDKFILELYRLSALDGELYRANIYEKVMRLTQLNEEILSKFVLFGLLMEKGSKEYERIFFTYDLFLRISWDAVDDIRDLKFISDLTIKTEIIEYIKEYISSYPNIFNEAEIKNMQEVVSKNSYDALVKISANCAAEIHDYIVTKKAA